MLSVISTTVDKKRIKMFSDVTTFSYGNLTLIDVAREQHIGIRTFW
jgi:hypothetical protein